MFKPIFVLEKELQIQQESAGKASGRNFKDASLLVSNVMSVATFNSSTNDINSDLLFDFMVYIYFNQFSFV